MAPGGGGGRRARRDEPASDTHSDLFFDHAGVMLVVLGPDGGIERINRKACAVLEVEREAVVGRNWFDLFIPTAERERVHAAFRKIMRGNLEPVEHFENLVVTGSGRERLVLWHNTVLRDGGGTIRFSLSSGEDVTDVRERERELVESRERFRTVFEKAGDGILVADAETKMFVAANPSACRLLGYELDELLEMGVDDIHPPERLPDVVAAFERQLRGELDVASDLPVRRKDGRVLWVDIASTPLTFDGRRCMVGIFRDVTTKRALDEKLLQTQKLEGLGILAGGLAHDLNNILVSVLGYSDLIRQDSPGPDELRTYLDAVVAGARQAGDLCQRLLEYAGKSSPTVERVDVRALVRDARALMDVSTLGSVKLDVDASGPPLHVACVPSQIRQVLLNVVTNAAEAIGEGRGSIRVSIRRQDVSPELVSTWMFAQPAPSGRGVLLEVVDDGPGMDDETRRTIFDPFFSTKSEGRGLGLSAAVGIVRHHGGSLTVDSEPGSGTTVRIVLPLASEERDASPKPDDPSADVGRSRLVVVADDNAAVRQITQVMLASAGFDVAVAVDGPSAVEAFKAARKPVSAMLLDVKMPGGSGIEAASAIREIAPDVPVLFVSGFNEEAIPPEELPHGMVAFLQKPFTADELLAKLFSIMPS